MNPGYKKTPTQRNPGYNEPSRWAPPWQSCPLIQSCPLQRIPGYNESFARVQRVRCIQGSLCLVIKWSNFQGELIDVSAKRRTLVDDDDVYSDWVFCKCRTAKKYKNQKIWIGLPNLKQIKTGYDVLFILQLRYRKNHDVVWIFTGFRKYLKVSELIEYLPVKHTDFQTLHEIG